LAGRAKVKRNPILLAFLMLLLSTLACGTGGLVTRRNNELRRAALAYELSTRGPVDEVMVAFGLTEVRDNLGFEGGNTVWLNQFAQAEYFRKRDANQSYLFLHDLDYEGRTATIVIDRGDANGIQYRRLTLRREGTAWEVVSDEPLESPSSPSR
jgi:hypothetical protein